MNREAAEADWRPTSRRRRENFTTALMTMLPLILLFGSLAVLAALFSGAADVGHGQRSSPRPAALPSSREPPTLYLSLSPNQVKAELATAWIKKTD